MRFFAVALIFFGVAASYAQTPEVPHKMRFADMTLTIRDDARREIQKDVDALTRSPKYFGIKVERARTYFPLIEKVFAEERLPDDFKYLVLQESALIADAVSVSNAVGFWQFKDFTAMEMGMRVDKDIDERMNIVSASRGAAKYLKQSNFMFNNWLLALQAYQMGAGAVRRSVSEQLNGEKHMDITSDTYWYVKKFLAHKVAFEDAVKGEPQVKVEVIELRDNKSVNVLAKELGVDEVDLRSNNKWIRSHAIPGDRTYALLVPKGKFNPEFNVMTIATPVVANNTSASVDKDVKPDKASRKEINGVMTIQALPNENHVAIASRSGVSLSQFLKYNDISISDPIKAGAYYFTSKKKNKSGTLTHTLAEGEDLWSVSQRYGVALNRVKKLNRITAAENLKSGDVVWLGAKKPLEQRPVEQPAEMVVVENTQSEFFEWGVNPGESKSGGKGSPLIVSSESGSQLITANTEESKVVENNGVHVVVAGETLYSISKKYNVAVTELLEWNQLNITQSLRPGQVLNTINPSLPGQAEAKVSNVKKDGWIMHDVKNSDTLFSIARQYNVTIKEIMDWNGKSDFTLAQGEKLKILTK